MRIQDRFTVSVPLDEAWQVLLDVERVAPCLPGAQLQEIDGDDYRGVVKVKLGAITAQFKGTVRFTEVDEAAHRVVMSAQAREVRGQGNASATVTTTLRQADGGTEAEIDTDLAITGRMAQFGRGVMGDVSSKLLGEFARCLEERLHGKPGGDRESAPPDAPSPAVAAVPEAVAEPGATPAASTPEPEPAAAAPPTQRRVVQSATAEPVDLLAVAGPSFLRRGLPVALLGVLVLLAVTKGSGKRWVLASVGAALVAASAAAGRRG